MKHSMDKVRKMLIVCICVLIIIYIALRTINGNRKTSYNFEDLIEEEQEYYDKLQNYRHNNHKNIEVYIDYYVKYKGYRIPTEKLKYIKDLTEEQFFNSVVKSAFIIDDNEHNEYSYKPQEDESDPREYRDIDGDIGVGIREDINSDEVVEEEILSGDNLIYAIYIYKTDTYIAKIQSSNGKVYTLRFKMDNWKVVDIYAN